MAIEKYNLYMPAQNLTNLSLNVDINRIGIDKINIDVNYGTSPATVSIKEGSIIEVNGNLYVINGSDYTFQMANATHNYITFTDNPSPAFGSAAARGTYRDDKKGFYQVDNVSRTLGWFIDQSNDLYCLDSQYKSQNLTKFKCRSSACNGTFYKVIFDDILYDNNDEFDAINKRFAAQNGGYYLISCFVAITWVAGGNVSPLLSIYLNGSDIQFIRNTYIPGSASIASTGINFSYLIQLKKGDYIEIYAGSGLTNSVVNTIDSYLDIVQLA
jgi:hypothetical protein